MLNLDDIMGHQNKDHFFFVFELGSKTQGMVLSVLTDSEAAKRAVSSPELS